MPTAYCEACLNHKKLTKYGGRTEAEGYALPVEGGLALEMGRGVPMALSQLDPVAICRMVIEIRDTRIAMVYFNTSFFRLPLESQGQIKFKLSLSRFQSSFPSRHLHYKM